MELGSAITVSKSHILFRHDLEAAWLLIRRSLVHSSRLPVRHPGLDDHGTSPPPWPLLFQDQALTFMTSRTQCITGATVGVALCNGDLRSVNWRAIAWIFSGCVHSARPVLLPQKSLTVFFDLLQLGHYHSGGGNLGGVPPWDHPQCSALLLVKRPQAGA